jgi:hypothetical protein
MGKLLQGFIQCFLEILCVHILLKLTGNPEYAGIRTPCGGRHDGGCIIKFIPFIISGSHICPLKDPGTFLPGLFIIDYYYTNTFYNIIPLLIEKCLLTPEKKQGII